MGLRQEARAQSTPRDVFVARLHLLKSSSEAHRLQLTRTREAVARRTADPDLLQLAETMKVDGVILGQERADAAWLEALRRMFGGDYSTIVGVWRRMDEVRQEMDRDPSEIPIQPSGR